MVFSSSYPSAWWYGGWTRIWETCVQISGLPRQFVERIWAGQSLFLNLLHNIVMRKKRNLGEQCKPLWVFIGEKGINEVNKIKYNTIQLPPSYLSSWYITHIQTLDAKFFEAGICVLLGRLPVLLSICINGTRIINRPLVLINYIVY